MDLDSIDSDPKPTNPSRPSSHNYSHPAVDTAHQRDRDMSMDINMDMDTDEIHSADSDELHERRPNRWRGHPSTWRTWTERDRRTWYALESARKADLAVHLFNAFGLKKGLREGPVVEGQDGDGGKDWKPGNLWTAWPVRANEVPDDDLLPRTRDAMDLFTLRRGSTSREFAGQNLEGEISATMLRYAKERFQRRHLQAQATNEVVASIEEAESDSEEGDTSDAAGKTGSDKPDSDAPIRTAKRRRLASSSFSPVLSADDDRSYALLRPAARRIMSKLDNTLMVLHNARVSGLANMFESSSSDEDEEEVEPAPAERGLTRSSEPPKPKPAPAPKGRGGRPRKVHVPQEGETEREMLIRIARESKRRLPRFSPDTAESEEENGAGGGLGMKRKRRKPTPSPAKIESGAENEHDGRRSASRVRRSISDSRASSRSSKPRSGDSVGSPVRHRSHRLTKWGLRDWHDVLGAAALAGFSPAVIARAAQRCSTLFREEMVVHTLPEQSVTSDKDRVQTVRYIPDAPMPSSSDDEDDQEDVLLQHRIISRQPSVRLTGTSSPDAETETAANTPRGSRSATPGPLHFCPYPDCPWAIKGFTKRNNLTRHLRRTHGDQADEVTEGEEDSMDEMHGGVHVDGFLQPIKLRKGWRAEDTQQRLSRKGKGRRSAMGRAGSDELGSDAQYSMRDALSSS
ncbi:hypothetical protein N656DRAFT_765589 [Canariomyces notabilis]|uniref:Rrn9 domain-containing protein n=1 Tax=Canariomyces notabilis TaxID=2074819 RepID=A0AAN6TLK9_9PEZI|nr:hypothetical protein N656DRAFT_765589 [Canariomyces arenarius]